MHLQCDNQVGWWVSSCMHACMSTAVRFQCSIETPMLSKCYLAVVNALVARRQLPRSMRAGRVPSAIARSEGDPGPPRYVPFRI